MRDDEQGDGGAPGSSSRSFERFHQELGDFAWRQLSRRGVPAADLEDASQEVFLIAWRQWTKRTSPNDQAYIYRVCQLFSWNESRRRRKRPQLPGDVPDPGIPANQEREAMCNEERRVVESALGRLPPEQAEAWYLKYVEQWQNSDIALAQRCHVNTVEHRIKVAHEAVLAALRRHELQKRPPPEEPGPKDEPDGDEQPKKPK